MSIFSKAVELDFIAYHDIQAQVGLSTFCELSKHIKCNWLIGPHARRSKTAIGAVMMDHAAFQKNVKKSLFGYRYLFHLSHDLGDIDIYRTEKRSLSTYDVIFAPTSIHANAARESIGGKVRVIETGWPKYEALEVSEKHSQFVAKIKGMSKRPTILYAPTFAENYEWKDLFPALLDLEDVNIIVKNHIYVNPGQPFPSGQEKEYAIALASINEMEQMIVSMCSSRALVAPRELNICALFAIADIAISDRSSMLAEFLPFGTSIETGRYGRFLPECKPEISKIFAEIKYLSSTNLLDFIKRGRLSDLMPNRSAERQDVWGLLRPNSGQIIANEVLCTINGSIHP